MFLPLKILFCFFKQGSWTEYSQRATQDMADMTGSGTDQNPAAGG